MLTDLMSKINVTLTSVTELAVIYDRPLAEGEAFTNYPAAVYYYANINNAFETNQENLKEYFFTIVLVTETKVKGMEDAHGTVMAELIDAVIDQFDADWDQGASSEGHRIWWIVESVSPPALFEEQSGLLLSTELNLKIRVITND